MEPLLYNISEEEFSKSSKILLWIFVLFFFIGGLVVLLAGPVFGFARIKAAYSIAPFGISFIVGLIATLSSVKSKNLFFRIDDDKIEFRYGFIKPKIHTFLWENIKEVVIPQREKKIKLNFTDGTSFVINLIFLEGHKSFRIRKNLFTSAKYKDMNVKKVPALAKEGIK